MQNITDDRPIPAVVEEMARAGGNAGYVATVEAYREEIVERIYKYRKRVGALDMREVLRRTPSGKTYGRDLYFAGLGGWVVLYDHAQAKRAFRRSWYAPHPDDFGLWTEWKMVPGITVETVAGLEIMAETKYKYSGYTGAGDLIDYLAKWEVDPKVEMFGKLGIWPRKTLMQKAAKDRQFCRFLRDHAAEVDLYGPQATLAAYKTGETIEAARRRLHAEQLARYDFANYVPAAHGLGLDALKAMAYIEAQRATIHEYNDYIQACRNLGLDMADTKNAYPHDFARMHELRVDEDAAKRARERRDTMAKLAEGFRTASGKWARTAICAGGFCVIIPESPDELVSEGAALHHCVGKMGYDKKVADGKSLIAFIRREEDPAKPYVTAEYRLDEHKLTQVYGDHDSRPPETVVAFANEWAATVAAWEQKYRKQEKERAKA